MAELHSLHLKRVLHRMFLLVLVLLLGILHLLRMLVLVLVLHVHRLL